MSLWCLLLAIDLVLPPLVYASDALESDDECQLNGCGLSALQHRSSKSSVHELQGLSSASSALSIYQWNPHWQCFYQGGECKEHAKGLLNRGLQDMHVDFANVIELIDDSYQPPPGFGMLKSTCNDKENALLIYDSSKWKPSSKANSRVSGCITYRDRAFNVQMFESLSGSPLSQVVVVGAHYPHYINVPRLRDSLAQVVHATSVEKTIFIGDTNQEEGDSGDVARAVGMPDLSGITTSEMAVTCCHQVNEGFVWKFDRIITNFGTVAGTRVFEVPSWAAPSMHKAVHATIQMP